MDETNRAWTHTVVACLEGAKVTAGVQSMDEMILTVESVRMILPASAAKNLIKEAQAAYHEMSRLSELADPVPQL